MVNIQAFETLAGWQVYDREAGIAEWQGARALRLGSGSPVLKVSEPVHPPFEIRCEVAVPGPEGFVGCVFGAKGAAAYEAVYIYPAEGGEVQYDSSMNGSMTWQAFHGPSYQARVSVPVDSWIPLTVSVYRGHAEVSVGAVEKPQLHIEPYLQAPVGRVGLWGYLETYVRSFQVLPCLDNPVPPGSKPEPPDQVITDWTVKPAASFTFPVDLTGGWRQAAVEENGVVVLNRAFSTDIGQAHLQANVISANSVERTLRFGYSDRLRLWLNGTEVYNGEWRWDPPHSDGRIRLEQASVPVRLRQGQNSLVACLGVDEPFGWGLIMALD